MYFYVINYPDIKLLLSPHHLVFFRLWPVSLCRIFRNYLTGEKNFRKKIIWHEICLLNFLASFIWNFFPSKNNLANYYYYYYYYYYYCHGHTCFFT